MNGLNSLMNDAKMGFHRGDRISYTDKGKTFVGRYVMASSFDDHIVLNVGGRFGTPRVVSIDSIIKVNGKTI